MPSFYELRHGDWFENDWVRKPKNMKMLHETFKYFGYKRLLQKAIVSQEPFMLEQLYIERDMYELLDSLLLSYRDPQFKEKYYKQFWQRRAFERNDSMVYVILQDVKKALSTNTVPQRKPVPQYNDTLYQLLWIEFGSDTITPFLAQRHFNALHHFGFHGSAYNLLFERYAYYNIPWNVDSLKAQLKPVSQAVYPWFEDDTK
jgi:hypothetical protein